MSDIFAIAFWFLVHVIGGIAEALAALIILCGLLNIAAIDRKSTRLNSSHVSESRMPSSA